VIGVVLELKPPGGKLSLPVKFNPPGTKKLVPTFRSNNNRIPADNNTPKGRLANRRVEIKLFVPR